MENEVIYLSGEEMEIEIPDVQEHCLSAPNSPQNEDENRSGEQSVDMEASSNVGNEEAGNEEGSRGGDREPVVEKPASSSEATVSNDDEDQAVVCGGSKDSSTSFSSSSDEAGRFLVRQARVLEEPEVQGENEESLDALDAFPTLGPKTGDIEMLPMVEFFRGDDWVSAIIRSTSSLYEAGDDMSWITNKLNRKGFVFVVEGMGEDEHAATWPGSLKFVMYDKVVSDMNVRPPFTKLQQEVLTELDLAPSQLHPNGWAFLRAYELVCLFFERRASCELFLHLFEVNRNNDAGKPRHVSLRAKRGNKCFRPYDESLQGRWTEYFYWVTPFNEEAIRNVGRYGDRLSEGRMVNTVESTKFPIGWHKSHFDKRPASYHHKSDWLLSNEDNDTKSILQFISSQIPFNDPKHEGMPTKKICQASTKAEVLKELSMIFAF